jgi:hypothetical protein
MYGALTQKCAVLEQQQAVLLRSLARATEQEETREAQLISMSEYVDKLQEQVSQFSGALQARENDISLLTAADKERLVAVTKEWIEEGKFTSTLETIKAVCDDAGTPGEYAYIANKLAGSTEAQLYTSDPSKAALRTGTKAAFAFLMNLQATGQKVDLISSAIDLMSDRLRSEFFQSVVGHSKRQAQRTKQAALLSYDSTISTSISAQCLSPDGKQWRRLLFLCDDDFTRYSGACARLSDRGQLALLQ